MSDSAAAALHGLTRAFGGSTCPVAGLVDFQRRVAPGRCLGALPRGIAALFLLLDGALAKLFDSYEVIATCLRTPVGGGSAQQFLYGYANTTWVITLVLGLAKCVNKDEKVQRIKDILNGTAVLDTKRNVTYGVCAAARCALALSLTPTERATVDSDLKLADFACPADSAGTFAKLAEQLTTTIGPAANDLADLCRGDIIEHTITYLGTNYLKYQRARAATVYVIGGDKVAPGAKVYTPLICKDQLALLNYATAFFGVDPSKGDKAAFPTFGESGGKKKKKKKVATKVSAKSITRGKRKTSGSGGGASGSGGGADDAAPAKQATPDDDVTVVNYTTGCDVTKEVVVAALERLLGEHKANTAQYVYELVKDVTVVTKPPLLEVLPADLRKHLEDSREDVIKNGSDALKFFLE